MGQRNSSAIRSMAFSYLSSREATPSSMVVCVCQGKGPVALVFGQHQRCSFWLQGKLFGPLPKSNRNQTRDYALAQPPPAAQSHLGPPCVTSASAMHARRIPGARSLYGRGPRHPQSHASQHQHPSQAVRLLASSTSIASYDFGQRQDTFVKPVDDLPPPVRRAVEHVRSTLGNQAHTLIQCNYYLNGSVGISPHQDNELCIDQAHPIVSVTFCSNPEERGPFPCTR